MLDVLQKNPKSLEQTSAAGAEVLKEGIVDNSGYKYTKEDICSICNIGHSTFERFASSSVADRDFISVGSSHKKLTDFQSTQIGYYTKKYHSLYDDYENY